MTTTTQSQMQEVDARFQAAVARSVAKGVDHKTAWMNHMLALAAQWPTVAAAYMTWIASK